MRFVKLTQPKSGNFVWLAPCPGMTVTKHYGCTVEGAQAAIRLPNGASIYVEEPPHVVLEQIALAMRPDPARSPTR